MASDHRQMGCWLKLVTAPFVVLYVVLLLPVILVVLLPVILLYDVISQRLSGLALERRMRNVGRLLSDSQLAEALAGKGWFVIENYDMGCNRVRLWWTDEDLSEFAQLLAEDAYDEAFEGRPSQSLRDALASMDARADGTGARPLMLFPSRVYERLDMRVRNQCPDRVVNYWSGPVFLAILRSPHKAGRAG